MKAKEYAGRVSLVLSVLSCAVAMVSCGDDDDDEYTSVDSYATEYVDGHGAVDLGLSVLWASCNVGASSPSDYGKYYAWGEVSTKDEYSEESSKTSGVELPDISGYSSNDVATANWGDSWRLPTEDECQELIDDCTWEWTKVNGKNGFLVTGPSGSSLFLPAAGWRSGSSLNYDGEYGNYWGSTPADDDTQRACSIDFSADSHNLTWAYRYYGESIRPVTEP